MFIFEHVVGGGGLYEALPPELVGSAAAMLDAAIADFKRAGCEVVTTRDVRVEPRDDGARTFTLSPGDDVGEAFDRAAREADASLVIAPESEGVLLNWARRLERLNARSLGSRARAIELGGDKVALHDHWRAHGVPTPRTTLDARALDVPMVAKPRMGAGCTHTHVWRDEVARGRERGEGEGEFVYQPWCRGRAVSVSLIVGERGVRVLAAGEQFVREEEGRLRYEGGRLPMEEALAERASALAVRAVEAVAVAEGLHGFVGVDLLLGDEASEDVVIEINPRLTLSYVALTWGCEPTVAAGLLHADVEPVWTMRGVGGRGRVRFDAHGRVVVEG